MNHSMPWLKPEGIYSHLALKDDESNQVQFRRFMDAVNALEQDGCHFHWPWSPSEENRCR